MKILPMQILLALTWLLAAPATLSAQTADSPLLIPGRPKPATRPLVARDLGVPSRAVEWLGLDGDHLLYVVPESAQASGDGEARDLNGDGDLDDRALFHYRFSSGRERLVTTLCQVEPAPEPRGLLGGVLLFSVSQADLGIDVDGDGDLDDVVAHAYDVRTGQLTSAGISSARNAQLFDRSESLTLLHGEYGSFAWHLDGSPPVPLPDGILGLTDTGDFGILFGVWEQVAGDLNGDLDAFDTVVHVYDAPLRTVFNLGLAQANSQQLQVRGDRLGFTVRESGQGEDLNGDGDVADDVLHYADRTTGQVTNLGLDAQYFEQGGGHTPFYAWRGFLVGDDYIVSRNGSDPLTTQMVLIDLQSGLRTVLDSLGHTWPYGALGDERFLVYGITGAVAEHRLVDVERGAHVRITEAYMRGLVGSRLVLNRVVGVDQVGAFVNLERADLDRPDPLASGTSFGPRVHVTLSLDEYNAVYLHSESVGGTDLNGDGDQDDYIGLVHSFGARDTAMLGEWIWREGRVIASCHRTVAWKEFEQDAGADLNGDGDLGDGVLRAARLTR